MRCARRTSSCRPRQPNCSCRPPRATTWSSSIRRRCCGSHTQRPLLGSGSCHGGRLAQLRYGRSKRAWPSSGCHRHPLDRLRVQHGTTALGDDAQRGFHDEHARDTELGTNPAAIVENGSHGPLTCRPPWHVNESAGFEERPLSSSARRIPCWSRPGTLTPSRGAPNPNGVGGVRTSVRVQAHGRRRSVVVRSATVVSAVVARNTSTIDTHQATNNAKPVSPGPKIRATLSGKAANTVCV